jgi:hypothetical protein
MWAWLGAAALGGGVGLAELVTRYRDRPSALLPTLGFWAYLLLNAGASAAALGLIRVFDWTLGQEAGSARTTTQVLVAGLAAMALFRSSLLNLKIGTEDVSIGPSALLASLLVVVDRGIDRRRATQRSRSISQVMKDVSFSKAKISLPAYCLQLMQNVPLDEQEKLRTAVEMLELAKMDEDLKALNLGLLLMNTVGPAVLDAAVRDLDARIKHEEPAPPDAPTSPAPTSPAIGVQPHPVPAVAQAPDQATV